jgi:hypothetical protein
VVGEPEGVGVAGADVLSAGAAVTPPVGVLLVLLVPGDGRGDAGVVVVAGEGDVALGAPGVAGEGGDAGCPGEAVVGAPATLLQPQGPLTAARAEANAEAVAVAAGGTAAGHRK